MPRLVDKIILSSSSDIQHIYETKQCVYTFLNPVSYLDALCNYGLFSKFDGIFADGSLLVTAIKVLYGKKIKRISFDMTSLASILFEYASEHVKTLYIVASKQEEVEQAIKIFKEHYPKLQIVGYRNGYFESNESEQKEAEFITNLNPDFLIVGMGALMQEQFLLKVKEAGFQGIGFTCGGFIHQTAQNKIDYYPQWINRMNLRFLYRMYKEKHTRKRYLQAALIFPARFLYERIFGK